MLKEMTKEKKFTSPTIVQSSLSSDNDTFTSLSTSALLAKNSVPLSHKRVADNYMIIKKIYKFQVLNSHISNQETALLKKYDFSMLEFSTIKQINEELAYLKKWAFSSNETLVQDANEIIQIRVKELKYITAGRYCAIDDEAYDGYKALERYFEEITKFYR
jgi:hypothetical protein